MKIRGITELRLTVIIIMTVALSSAHAQWNPPVQMTSTDGVEETHIGTAAIDGNDRFHLTWAERGQGSSLQRILHLEGTPGNWGAVRQIAPEGENWTPDVAAHLNGASHLVWTRGMLDQTEIWYASNTSGSWVSERITNNPSSDVYPAVAVDGDDIPHVAWAGFDPETQKGRIFYAKKNTSGSWIIKRIGRSQLGDFWAGATPRIAVSLDGVPQITYRGGNYGQYRVHHTTNVTGGWQFQILPTGNAEDYASSIRVDPYGLSYVAMSGDYGWGPSTQVYYATSLDRGITWSLPSLVSAQLSASGPVLGIDWYGNAHMAWQETAAGMYRGRVFHATNRGGSWASQAVTGPDENFRPSLVQDGSGKSHIFYTWSTYDGTFHNEVFYVSDRQPTVTVNMVPLGSTVIPRGGSLPLEITVKNETGAAVDLDFWMTGILAGTGSERPIPSSALSIPNPIRGRIPAGMTITRTITLAIPLLAPARLFTLTASVGNQGQVTYRDRAALAVRIVP